MFQQFYVLLLGYVGLFFLPVDRNIAGVLHIVADDVEAAGKRNFTYTVDRKRSEIVKLNQIDMRGSTHEVDRYSQYQLPPGRAQSTFLLLHQRCGCGKVLLRYFLTEKVTKR